VRVEVTTNDEATYRIIIRDTGVGFDGAAVERLFQAFSKADESLTRKFGGLGVGLSLARDAARAMGGDIFGDGKPGGGAVFTVVMPLPPTDEPQAAIPIHQARLA
jgi:signal transduction histidine kinase